MDNELGSTHQRILQQGLEIVSERGLAGITLGTLATRAGISKSGLFAHFRSKEELQIELLRTAEAALKREVVTPAMQEPKGLPQLHLLIRRWLGWAARSGLPGGCPLYAAAFELDDAEGTARDHLVQSKQTWSGLLENLTAEAVKLGHLKKDLDVAQFVWQLEGIYLAHHVAERLMRDPEADDRAHTAVEALFATSLPE